MKCFLLLTNKSFPLLKKKILVGVRIILANLHFWKFQKGEVRPNGFRRIGRTN